MAMERAFKTLGLTPQASLIEAKQRFRELAHSYHPYKIDKNLEDKQGAHLEFVSIAAAFKTVKSSYGRPPRRDCTSQRRQYPPGRDLFKAEPFVDPTGLVRDLYDRRCLCEYCFSSRTRGKFAVHDRSSYGRKLQADEDALEPVQRAVTSMLICMVKEDPQHSETSDLGVQEELALWDLDYLMASTSIVFDAIMRKALHAEQQPERAEKWWTWREGWPLTPSYDVQNDASSFGKLLPLTKADFPTNSLSATLNFCVMLMSEHTRFKQERLLRCNDFYVEMSDSARVAVLQDQAQAWRALLSALLAVEQLDSRLMENEVRDVVVQGLVETVLAYVSPQYSSLG